MGEVEALELGHRFGDRGSDRRGLGQVLILKRGQQHLYLESVYRCALSMVKLDMRRFDGGLIQAKMLAISKTACEAWQTSSDGGG